MFVSIYIVSLRPLKRFCLKDNLSFGNSLIVSLLFIFLSPLESFFSNGFFKIIYYFSPFLTYFTYLTFFVYLRGEDYSSCFGTISTWSELIKIQCEFHFFFLNWWNMLVISTTSFPLISQNYFVLNNCLNIRSRLIKGINQKFRKLLF